MIQGGSLERKEVGLMSENENQEGKTDVGGRIEITGMVYPEFETKLVQRLVRWGTWYKLPLEAVFSYTEDFDSVFLVEKGNSFYLVAIKKKPRVMGVINILEEDAQPLRAKGERVEVWARENGII